MKSKVTLMHGFHPDIIHQNKTSLMRNGMPEHQATKLAMAHAHKTRKLASAPALPEADGDETPFTTEQ